MQPRTLMWWFRVTIVVLFACGTSGSRPPPGPAPAPQDAPTQDQAPPATGCASDGECKFADPCQPVRCVASSTHAACDHPAPSEGSCVCFEGTCALRPSSPRVSKQSCNNTGDCDVDVTTATCEPGIVPDDEFRVRYTGPTCGCDERDHRCHLRWFDPIPCQTTDDCWVDETPVPHPIERPKRLRGREFKGCVDGERVPACDAGHCTLKALKC